MHFTICGNKELTSLPIVIIAITYLAASFLSSGLREFNSAYNSASSLLFMF